MRVAAGFSVANHAAVMQRRDWPRVPPRSTATLQKKRGTLSGAHAIAERYPVCEHKVAAKSHCDTPGRGSTTLLAVLRSGGTLAMRATLLLLVVLERALTTIGASLPLSEIGVRNQAASPQAAGRQDGDE